MLSECLDHATPAQIVVQVFGRHPVESSHPLFQPRMVGIRVLDMVDTAQNSDPLAQVHRPMGHAPLPSRHSDRAFSSSIRAQDRIPGQKGFQHREGLPVVILREDRIGGRARPVPDHQDGNLFPGEPPFLSPTAPFSGPSREPAPLSLVGAQKPGFVGFADAAFLSGFQTGGQGPKPVSPQKGRLRVDPAPLGRLPDRFPLAECLQVKHPPILVVQSREGRVRQCIEGARTSPAPDAREPGGLSPRSDLRMVAMGTGRGGSHQRGHLGYQVFLVSMIDRNPQIMSLRRCHGRGSSKTSLE